MDLRGDPGLHLNSSIVGQSTTLLSILHFVTLDSHVFEMTSKNRIVKQIY